MKVRDLLTLGVEDLALGGKALARHEGCVVFVDRGLPGDRITARVSKKQRSFAEAKLVSVDEPSATRIEARCAHAGICGGCRLQELPYEQQIAIKERQVRETLQHLAGIANPRVNPIVPAPSPWHYRNKMEFSFMRAPDGSAVLGMHERGTWDKVFELTECWLTTPLVVEIVRLTQRFAREYRWEPYHPTQHVGVVRFLTVRHLALTGECAVHLIGASDHIDGLSAWAEAVAALSSDVKSVTLGINTSHSNVAFMEEEMVLRGSDAIIERLLGLQFEVVGTAFLQTNSAQAERLYQGALDAAQLTGDETVLDLYCGAGTMTLLFARAARRAVGVESIADAVTRARRNADLNGLGETQFECGEARQVMREWAKGQRANPVKPDLIVVDPPRAGLHPRVVFRCAELAPSRIVYVSCNPATLARDLKDFAAHGYELAEVTPYDMFPHTPHIECVARLVRTAGAK